MQGINLHPEITKREFLSPHKLLGKKVFLLIGLIKLVIFCFPLKKHKCSQLRKILPRNTRSSPFTPLHQYAYSPYCSLYIFLGAFEEHLNWIISFIFALNTCMLFRCDIIKGNCMLITLGAGREIVFNTGASATKFSLR